MQASYVLCPTQTGAACRSDLSQALDLPVVVTNDVRAAPSGEWLHGRRRSLAYYVVLLATEAGYL
jgi:predicted NBD/HSP70 family sugar kinase